MKQEFFKYQGTGNDFVLIDNRSQLFDSKNTALIAKLCDRRFGIGADGLILLEPHETEDFKMIYFNSDGNESSMCGNGGRCIVDFASRLGIIVDRAVFEAIDGLHEGEIDGSKVKLKMMNVRDIDQIESAIILNTGSPHFIKIEESIGDLNIDKEGAKIRYSDPFKTEGINVNFVEVISDDTFMARTYERGVEGETLSCGTGVTGVAIAMHYLGETEKNLINVLTKGGTLQVSFSKEGEKYRDVWLIGPAELVFKGVISW